MAHVAAELQIRPRVLIQANMSQESAKSGFSAEELRQQWLQIVRLHGTLQVEGLMTMAAESDDPENARPTFRSLRVLRDELLNTDASREANLTGNWCHAPRSQKLSLLRGFCDLTAFLTRGYCGGEIRGTVRTFLSPLVDFVTGTWFLLIEPPSQKADCDY